MLDPSLEIQAAIRARLASHPGILGEMPATSIFDGPTRPEQFPCIIIGDAQTVLEPVTLSRSHVRVFADIHVWTKGGDLAGTKLITRELNDALTDKPTINGFHAIDWKVRSIRFMRDPGEFGHAVLTIETLVGELA